MSKPAFVQIAFVADAQKCLAALEEPRKNPSKVLVDARQRFVEFGARNLIDLLDRLLRVFDGLDQVLALRGQEAMALGRFLVLIERHHVHRAHLLHPLAQTAAGLFFGGEFLAGETRNLRILAQYLRFDIHLGEATRLKVFKVGAQFGQLARKCGAVFAQLIQRGPLAAELGLKLGQLESQRLCLLGNCLRRGESSGLRRS